MYEERCQLAWCLKRSRRFLPALHRPDGRCDAGRKPAPTRSGASHVAAGFYLRCIGLTAGVIQVGNLHLRGAVPTGVVPRT